MPEYLDGPVGQPRGKGPGYVGKCPGCNKEVMQWDAYVLAPNGPELEVWHAEHYGEEE